MKPLHIAGAGVLGLVVLAPALLAVGSSNASGLSPQLADAPPGLVPLAFQASTMTGIDANVLLAIAKVETNWGHAQNGQSDDLVPADLREHIDAGALLPGGATAVQLGLAGGRRLGDWVNPVAVGNEHAVGFMQFLPSIWRVESALAPGRPLDPYRPLEAMTTAGSYLARLQNAAKDGVRRSLREALAVYGGDGGYADNILALAQPRPSASVERSNLQPISCSGITLTQGYGPTSQVGEPIINGVLFHTGWDLACPAGTPVVSVTAGRAHVTLGYGGGFGNNVQVQVGDLWVRYAHLEAVLIGDGHQVGPGTVVGLEGSTGFSTGPHLHFEVDRGCPAVTCSIDPSNLISLPVAG